MKKVRWSALASRQFEAIHARIAKSSPAAQRQSSFILASIRQLERFPLSGVRFGERGRLVVTVPRTPYLVHYRLDAEVLHIVSIRHGAQKPLQF